MDCIHDERQIRLVDTSSEPGFNPIQIKYACLSHCWGKSRIASSTTMDKLQTYKQAINLSELPRNFKDAVELCRALQIRYLWIDSLCIIQGDTCDWENHVDKMTEIYSGSLLTFGAAVSTHSNGGLFRRPISNQTTELRVHHDKSTFALSMRRPLIHWLEENLSGQSWPLMRRGWVLQEYLLSPRFVAFADEEIVWHCDEQQRCCCGDISGSHWLGQYNDTKDRISRLEGLSVEQTRQLWMDIVGLYSATSLTYASDKLPAIAGIAKLFKVRQLRCKSRRCHYDGQVHEVSTDNSISCFATTNT